MPTGTVKWFNNTKGYGFILPHDGGEDLFAHYSAINMDGFKTLKAGQEVSFEVTQCDKGLHATAITPAGIPSADKHPNDQQGEDTHREAGSETRSTASADH